MTSISNKSNKSKAGGDETSSSSDKDQIEIDGKRSETRISEINQTKRDNVVKRNLRRSLRSYLKGKFCRK